jgi:UDP-N-acetylmuramate--alanine ligase
MNLESVKRIYFIGIGGIGMSALARYFKKHGAEVHGYDRTETDLTRALTNDGIQVHYDDNPDMIPENVDMAVWTPAVPADHKELNWFREHGVPLKKRAEVLGIISKSRRCIAVGGTHGKTTTSTMTMWLLRATGVDVTAFVGGISGNLGSNFIEGDSDWVVVEADEYDRSFLQLYPEVAVINSVDADHLDIYGDEASVRKSYEQFAAQVRAGGLLLLQSPDVFQGKPWITDALTMSFGVDSGDYRASNIRVERGFTMFDLLTPGHGTLTNLQLPYPGLHNVCNATAAIAATLYAGGDIAKIPAALADFKGVKRRFEYIARTVKGTYIDDYAHHPAELEATIQAARSLFPGVKLTGVFQPHLFSRTRDFADAFAVALDKLDECLLLPIYPARELPIEGITSEMILGKMKSSQKQVIQKVDLLKTIDNKQPELLITMGAGDIDLFVQPFKQLFEQ